MHKAEPYATLLVRQLSSGVQAIEVQDGVEYPEIVALAPKNLHSNDYNLIVGRHVRRPNCVRIGRRKRLPHQAATYFNRKLLVTTVTLDSAMAADASMGESSPRAATGIPMTL